MLSDIIFALWFFIPAGVANMVPIVAARAPLFKHWNTPIDFGATFRGKRVFGSHKTWRGVVCASIAATLALWLQQYAVRRTGWFASSPVDYEALPMLILGPLFAIGALAGDAAESFFKRQRNMRPGQAWLPYDLADHIVGAALLCMPVVVFSWWVYTAVIIIWSLANFGVSYAGYALRIKERPV